MTPAERRAINERKGSEEIRAWVSARYSSDLIKKPRFRSSPLGIPGS